MARQDGSPGPVASEPTDAKMIVIVNYEMGNVGSIRNMLARLGIPSQISSDPAVIAKADRLILPGVGAFDQGMENLNKLGLTTALDDRVLGQGTPVLGICLGMQLMTRSSEEGVSAGLGWIDAETVHFKKERGPEVADMRLPHIGWNFVDPASAHGLLADLPEEPRFYFVHTYRVVCSDPEDVVLTADYGPVRFTAAFARGNIAGIQCHPEKSHKFGMGVLTNFARWAPSQVEERRLHA
jgi:glutamine amidotransferase